MAVLEEESADDLVGVLVDSDKAGQETAPITGPASTTPLEGLFQAGLLGRPALLSLLASELSPATALELSSGGEEEGVAFGDESDNGDWSAIEVESDDEEEDDDGSD